MNNSDTAKTIRRRIPIWLGMTVIGVVVVPLVVGRSGPPLPGHLELVREYGYWLRGMISKLPGWPLVVLLLGTYILWSERATLRIARMFPPFSAIKLWGAELVVEKEGAANAEQAADQIFSEYRIQVRREFERFAKKYSLYKMLSTVAMNAAKELKKSNPNLVFRSTIYVQDLLFADRLYQLLDYYPHARAAGRTQSVRFGIIGRAWRMEKSLCENEVQRDPEELIRNWGMLRKEAEQTSERHSFMCVFLKYKLVSVGMFYMDSTGAKAFPLNAEGQTKLATDIHRCCGSVGLTEALSYIHKELVGPEFELDRKQD